MPACRLALHGKSIRIGEAADMVTHARGKKTISGDEFGVQGETFAQGETTSLRGLAQFADLRPRCFRVNEIFCDRRDAAPIVDASLQQAREIRVAEVRRSLQGP